MSDDLKVEMYTKTVCPYCVKAKMLLQAKKVDVIEYNIEKDTEKRAELLKKAPGVKTVPQIFINGKHIEGGYDGIAELESKGELDTLLGR